MAEKEMKLPELLDSYLVFCRLRENAIKNGILDLSKLKWIYPTTLLPLGEFIHANKDTIKVVPPKEPKVASYVSIMTADSSWSQPQGSYIPIVRIPPVAEELEKSLQSLYTQYKQGECIGGESAFKYVVYELVGNIYEHSQFTSAFVMAQAYNKKRCMEICFFDNGITIPGNFEKHGIEFSDHVSAIIDALKGKSTKDQERGKGLGTSMKVLAEAIKGQALIVSGLGAVYLEGSDAQGYILSESKKLKGTLIGATVPFPSKEVDIYEYVK